MSDENEQASPSVECKSTNQKQPTLGIHRDLLTEAYRFLSRADVETGLVVSANYNGFLERNSGSFPLRHFEQFGLTLPFTAYGSLDEPHILLQHTDGRVDWWDMAENPDLPSIFRKVRNAFINKIQAVAPGMPAFLEEWQCSVAQSKGPTYAKSIVCSANVDSILSYFLNHLRVRDALFIYSFYSRQSLPDFLRSRLPREIHTLVIRANHMRTSLDPRDTEASSLLDFTFTSSCAKVELRCTNNGAGVMEWIDAYVERFRVTPNNVLSTLPCVLVENDERLYRDDLKEAYDGFRRMMPSSCTSPAASNVSNPLGQEVPCYAVHFDRKKCRDHFNNCDKYRFLHPSRRYELAIYQWRQCGFHMFCYMQISVVKAPRRLLWKAGRHARSKSL